MMLHSSRPGWIEVIAGVIFSGKTEELIRRVRRAVIARQRVQVFKSHLDDRYGGVYRATTHDGLGVEVEPVEVALDVMREIADIAMTFPGTTKTRRNCCRCSTSH